MDDRKPVERRRYGALELQQRVGPNLLKGLLIYLNSFYTLVQN